MVRVRQQAKFDEDNVDARCSLRQHDFDRLVPPSKWHGAFSTLLYGFTAYRCFMYSSMASNTCADASPRSPAVGDKDRHLARSVRRTRKNSKLRAELLSARRFVWAQLCSLREAWLTGQWVLIPRARLHCGQAASTVDALICFLLHGGALAAPRTGPYAP